ncbi:MAG: GNAT family N-acetyltransferase [Nitrosopumilaceae archaeon]|jgi:GNAT superfamily N-acetyltransferase
MIREATSSDKPHILKFCQNTFSWGDYIKDVWDYWLSEGILLVYVKNNPIGISHAVFLKDHVWIEGIRIDPNCRRQGIASKLVQQIETRAIKNKIPASLMLIDNQNTPSLTMSENLGYKKYQTWNFYSLLPQKTNSPEILFGSDLKENEFPHYVRSWRWISLDKETTSNLNAKSCVIRSGIVNKSTAILEDSEHFKKTVIVTLFAESESDTANLLSFLQNYGYEKNYQRVQILTKEKLPKLQNLDFKLSFQLMQKLLS